jgi:hypothetical protein
MPRNLPATEREFLTGKEAEDGVLETNLVAVGDRDSKKLYLNL